MFYSAVPWQPLATTHIQEILKEPHGVFVVTTPHTATYLPLVFRFIVGSLEIIFCLERKSNPSKQLYVKNLLKQETLEKKQVQSHL